GYLSIVTPMARSGSGYDLPQLLIRARALAGLPALAVDFEIYDRTAPLVHATAPPLPPAELERLRREVAARWTGQAMLAPLLDRDGWDVVGAVAAQPRGGGWPVSPWSLAAPVLLLVAGTQAARRPGLSSCSAWSRSARSRRCSPVGASPHRRGSGARPWRPGGFWRRRRCTSSRSPPVRCCSPCIYPCIGSAPSSPPDLSSDSRATPRRSRARSSGWRSGVRCSPPATSRPPWGSPSRSPCP